MNEQHGSEVDVTAVKTLVGKYLRSIDSADMKLAAEVWASTRISFKNSACR